MPAPVTCVAWNAKGKAEGKRAVMMHEEATGLSYVGNLGRAYGKRLVLWWRLRPGRLPLHRPMALPRRRLPDAEIGLTGPLQHLGKGDASAFGSLVGKDKLFAPSHVHNIYYCLDFDIDGTENAVEEFNYHQDKPGSPSASTAGRPKKETARSGKCRQFPLPGAWSTDLEERPRPAALLRAVPGGNGIYRGTSTEKFAQADLWVTRHTRRSTPPTPGRSDACLPSYLNDETIRRTRRGAVVRAAPAPPAAHGGLARHAHRWAGFTLRPRQISSTPAR